MLIESKSQYGDSTDVFAQKMHSKPSSIRVRLCNTGSYYGIKPYKLPNGRLLWPADAVQQLIDRGA